MANGIVIDDKTVVGGVGQTNPLPVILKNGTTGNNIAPATEAKQDSEIALLTDTLSSGSLTALNSTLEIDMNAQGAVSFQIAGTWAGTIALEATVDGTNWSGIVFFPSGFANNYKLTTTANGQFRAVAPMGFAKLRLRMSAYTSGTATATMNASLSSQETTGFFGVESVVNSTTTPLGIAGTFTGSFEDILDFSSITILVFADVAGTLYLDFSTDGTNTDHTETYTVTANGLNIVAMAEGRYIKARYVNGGTGQTTFRLQLIYRKSILISEILPVDTALVGTMDSLITRAVIAGKKPNGDYTNVQTTTAGNLKVSVEESVPPASIIAGRKTVTTTGTAEVLGTSQVLQVGLIIQALKTNTDNIFVGTSTVDKTTDKQYELEPGESIAVAVDNRNDIWIDVNVNGEGVQYIGS